MAATIIATLQEQIISIKKPWATSTKIAAGAPSIPQQLHEEINALRATTDAANTKLALAKRGAGRLGGDGDL